MATTMKEEDQFEVRTTRLSVLPRGESLFSEKCTHISIVDETAGEFLSIRQIGDPSREQTILIDKTEWPAIKEAIELIIGEINLWERKQRQ